MKSRAPDPCVVVIFGASGDLMSRKLAPALYNLQATGIMPERTAIVGTARSEYSDEKFRTFLREEVDEHSRNPVEEETWRKVSEDIFYVSADVTDEASWTKLKQRLAEIDEECGTQGNRVWYMATLPRFFGTIAEQIGKNGLLESGGWHRLVVEKPFGTNLASARGLNATLRNQFTEDEIFRIDHYLGKETVQNLLVFRFANAIFEPIWNHRYIDHVQITVAEEGGVGSRGDFYDQTGALRDVAQNHLLQLLALVTMEPPVSWDPDSIRDEKSKVLRAVRRPSISDCSEIVARGQYEGYRSEDGVPPRSATETFVAMRLNVDNWRWSGVPFYLRTGKALPARATEITIQFHRVPHLLFASTLVEELTPNQLTIRIQPDEGFSLYFGTKVPGPDVEVRTVDMEFDYEADFASGSPEAYERLLMDCMLGDQTLFTRSDEIEEAWEIIDPILDHWSQGGRPGTYPEGSWGPEAAEQLMRRDDRRWRNPGPES
jgi:glucose-6-phosphate 1-dehydrogenase